MQNTVFRSAVDHMHHTNKQLKKGMLNRPNGNMQNLVMLIDCYKTRYKRQAQVKQNQLPVVMVLNRS